MKNSFVEARGVYHISDPAYRPDTRETPIRIRSTHMKSLLPAATAMVFAATVNLSPASAASPPAPAPAGTVTGTPHYEWQYHYGKKARFEGHWVLVR